MKQKISGLLSVSLLLLFVLGCSCGLTDKLQKMADEQNKSNSSSSNSSRTDGKTDGKKDDKSGDVFGSSNSKDSGSTGPSKDSSDSTDTTASADKTGVAECDAMIDNVFEKILEKNGDNAITRTIVDGLKDQMYKTLKEEIEKKAGKDKNMQAVVCKEAAKQIEKEMEKQGL